MPERTLLRIERGNPTPEEIADRRFASGEIDADTYTAIHERLARRRASQHR